MSNIKKAFVRFNSQDLVATYDAETQLWTATATAPATSSYGQPDHVYKAEVFAQDQAGNSASVNSSDPTYGAQLKIRVLEKTKPVITDIHASATTVDAGGRIVFTFKVTDTTPAANV